MPFTADMSTLWADMQPDRQEWRQNRFYVLTPASVQEPVFVLSFLLDNVIEELFASQTGFNER